MQLYQCEFASKRWRLKSKPFRTCFNVFSQILIEDQSVIFAMVFVLFDKLLSLDSATPLIYKAFVQFKEFLIRLLVKSAYDQKIIYLFSQTWEYVKNEIKLNE